MKITKTELDEDRIIVWTDEDETKGFNFKLDDIKDKADLTIQVQKRVDKEKIKKAKKEKEKEKYEDIKCQTQT